MGSFVGQRGRHQVASDQSHEPVMRLFVEYSSRVSRWFNARRRRTTRSMWTVHDLSAPRNAWIRRGSRSTRASPVNWSRCPLTKSANSRPCASGLQDVAQRVEEHVPGKVGNREDVPFYEHEARFAASMRDIDLTACDTTARIRVTGDEERVGSFHQVRGFLIEAFQRFDLNARITKRRPDWSTSLNVLRTVSKRLHHLDGKPRCIEFFDAAIQSVSTPRVELQAEKTDGSALAEVGERWIVHRWQRLDRKASWTRRLDETGGTFEDRRPRPTFGIHQSDHEPRLFLEEFAMLIEHVVAHHAPAHGLHAVTHFQPSPAWRVHRHARAKAAIRFYAWQPLHVSQVSHASAVCHRHTPDRPRLQSPALPHVAKHSWRSRRFTGIDPW
ncbi:hypothetical protein ABIE51_002073 [Lysobacter sp. OAE881]